jgi:Rps23 Pro-64 3,4-dihydroxylase Tpa1-like proline 4-hydroxylase
VNEAVLHLRDGRSRAVYAPVGGAFHEILYFLRAPAAAAGKTVRFEAPGGEPIDVAAGDMARIEIVPPHALVRDFLTDAEQAEVLAFTLAHADAFQGSGVHEEPYQGASPTGERIRRSRVIEGPANAAMAALMMPKLKDLIPALWPRLGLKPFPLASMECQITAHGDGDFFAVHTDNGMPEIAHRRISYVYYFHREPKAFTGGHLKLYHTAFADGRSGCGAVAADIDPPRGGLMVFPTHVYHEVTPIRSTATALTDQRLTLNGWLF